MAQTSADEFGGAINHEALNRHVSRIEALLHERKELNETIGEVYAEAKEAGFQTPILREIIRERQLDVEVQRERRALLDAYRRALGMLADTPLGEAAMERADTEPVDGAAARTAAKPKPFAKQPVHPTRSRGRPKKIIFDREHPMGRA